MRPVRFGRARVDSLVTVVSIGLLVALPTPLRRRRCRPSTGSPNETVDPPLSPASRTEVLEPYAVGIAVDPLAGLLGLPLLLAGVEGIGPVRFTAEDVVWSLNEVKTNEAYRDSDRLANVDTITAEGQTITFGDSSNQEMCFTGLYRYPSQNASITQCTDVPGGIP